jgi:nitroimidazol reductase NimA-like FMN-containing flavoprotein (pyridoxamine 5'-phosphate oxidase superfamily)
MSSMAMSNEEIDSFLSVPRIARMATANKGRPHVVPVWYYYDGTYIVITVTKDTKKVRNLKENPYVSIVIDIIEGKPGNISFLNGKAVIIEGKVEIKDDIDHTVAIEMYERYVGKEALNNPMVQFSINLPRHILLVKPIKILSWDISKIYRMK